MFDSGRSNVQDADAGRLERILGRELEGDEQMILHPKAAARSERTTSKQARLVDWRDHTHHALLLAEERQVLGHQAALEEVKDLHL
jgi:hypothetical protein